MKKFFVFLLSFFICVFALVLILQPDKYINSAFSALKLWAFVVLPSLLPFFFLTLMLTKLGTIAKISKFFSPITKFLYNVGGVSAFVQIMSFISGYPVGARLISELKAENAIDEVTATKMSVFCSTSGPLFIAGSVGVAMLNSKTIGSILLLSHVLSAVLNGVLFRFYGDNRPIAPLLQKKQPQNLLADCAYSASISCLTVGTLICVFYVLSDVFADYKILYPLELVLTFAFSDKQKAAAFSAGLIECTKGCKMLSQTSGFLRLPLISAIIAFGGISVIAQSLAFLKSAKVKTAVFILGKITQSILAFLLCALFCFIFKIY